MKWHRDQTPGRIRGRKLQRINSEVLRKQPLCVRCLEFGRIKLAEVVDHITPLAKEKVPDNPYLPRQGLCRRCHSFKTAKDFGLTFNPGFDALGNPIEEGTISEGARQRRLPTGLPRSAIPLFIVCGPPGSGKSTYVREHKTDRDLVIDLDAIREELFGTGEKDFSLTIGPCLELRNTRLRALASDRTHERAFFIISCPEPVERKHWATMLGGQIVLLDVPVDVCAARIRADPSRKGKEASLIDVVRTWHRINREGSHVRGLTAFDEQGNPQRSDD